MNDKSLGMILATAISAPAMVLCCGGGLALLGSALAGLAGLLPGMGGGLSSLLAVGVSILLLAKFGMRRPKEDRRRSNLAPEPRS